MDGRNYGGGDGPSHEGPTKRDLYENRKAHLRFTHQASNLRPWEQWPQKAQRLKDVRNRQAAWEDSFPPDMREDVGDLIARAEDRGPNYKVQGTVAELRSLNERKENYYGVIAKIWHNESEADTGNSNEDWIHSFPPDMREDVRNFIARAKDRGPNYEVQETVAELRSLNERRENYYRVIADLNLLDEDPEHSQRVKERKERIDNLLEQLPTPQYALGKLSKRKWWKLFIDEPDRKTARGPKLWRQKEPGKLYDREQSPGHYRSMMELFERQLVKKPSNEQKKIDYEGYTKLHELATKYIVPEEARTKMRLPNGCEPCRYGEQRLGPMVYHWEFPGEDKPEERAEAFAAFKELSREYINGHLLCRYRSMGTQSTSNGIMELRYHKIKDGTESFYVTPLYTAEQGPQHINDILSSYYDRRDKPNQTRYQRLREIAKVIRNIAVTHQKRDGNGRSTVNGLLNILLTKEGFCPVILPETQSIFGGRKTIDGLVEAMLVGMRSFIKEVEKHPSDLLGRQTDRLNRIEQHCTNMERALSLLQEEYKAIGKENKAYAEAIRVLKDHLNSNRQSVNIVLEAQRVNYSLVQECFQKTTDFGETRDQILRARSEIASIGEEYSSEKSGLSLSQEDDTKIMERANELKAKEDQLVQTYNLFNQSTEKGTKMIEKLYDSSNKVLEDIKTRQR